MWRQTDIPILRTALSASCSKTARLDLGQRLTPLCEQDIMIIATGIKTHNLRETFSRHNSEPQLWAKSFDQWAIDSLPQDRRLLTDREHPPYSQHNHPTAEHIHPLLIAAGAAEDDDYKQIPVSGFEMNLFSRTSVQFGRD